eukprot:Gb_24036 [translate_table: standard]
MAAASMALFFSTCSMSRRDSISSPQFSRLALSRAAPLDKWGGFVSGARSIPIQGLSAPRIRTLSRQLLVAASYDQPELFHSWVEGVFTVLRLPLDGHFQENLRLFSLRHSISDDLISNNYKSEENGLAVAGLICSDRDGNLPKGCQISKRRQAL